MSKSKGKYGASMTMHRMKKPAKIKCDCKKCRHYRKNHLMGYCEYFDIFDPNKTECYRFWDPSSDLNARPTHYKKEKRSKKKYK